MTVEYSSPRPESPRFLLEGVRTTTDRYGKLVPGAETVVRSRWTDGHLYFLFTSHFNDLHLKSNPTILRSPSRCVH